MPQESREPLDSCPAQNAPSELEETLFALLRQVAACEERLAGGAPPQEDPQASMQGGTLRK